MSTEIRVPDYLKKMINTESSDGAELVSATGSVPRISLKGMKFRFIVDGEEQKAVKETINVIILGAQPQSGMSKTFYREKYNPNDSGPPDCSSQDGVRPDYWVSNPESPVCATCPQNKWGSATSMSGGKAKACRDSKRLMVVEAGDEPIDEATIFILNVTVSSLKALSEYGKLLVQNGVPMASCITQITMLDDSDYPRIKFDFVGILNEDLCVKSLERAKKREWESIDMRTLLDKPKTSAPQLGDNSYAEDAQVMGQRSQPAPTPQASVNDVLEQWGQD